MRRIFRDYASGKAPRQIASELNAGSVPGPGGRPWGDTTIRGQAERGTGILNNSLYIGQLAWNRCSYIKNPSTGKRVARVNPADQHQVTPVPELRIIDDELWQQVKVRQSNVRIEMAKDEAGNSLNRVHRRQFLLSGLLKCGVCGADYAIHAQDRYACSNRRSKGTCNNATAINRQAIETRVLSALKDRLLTPELVAVFVAEFQREVARLQNESVGNQARLTSQLTGVERKIEGVLRAIEDGAWNDTIKQRLTELEIQQKQLKAELASAGRADNTVSLHPNAASLYAAKVAELQSALNQPDIRLEAIEALRMLIDRITLTPDEQSPDGLRAELHGDLAMILSLASTPSADLRKLPGVLATKKPSGTWCIRGPTVGGCGTTQPPRFDDFDHFLLTGIGMNHESGARNHRMLTTLGTSC